MLIKSQIDRRTHTLNNYVESLKKKVYNQQYQEAKQLIMKSRQIINNSYIAPYNPNTVIIESLTNKRQKILKEVTRMEQLLMGRKYEIQSKKTHYGYNNQSDSFYSKLCSEKVGLYTSRFSITLQDTHKLDYQPIIITTNFTDIVISFQDQSYEEQIPIDYILTYQGQMNFLLLSHKHTKTNKQNYLMLCFESEAERHKWQRCIKMCKMISECKERKSHLWAPTQQHQQQTNFNFNRLEKYSKIEKKGNPSSFQPSSASFVMNNSFLRKEKPKQTYAQVYQTRESYGTNRGHLSLNYNRNKSPAYERMQQKDLSPGESRNTYTHFNTQSMVEPQHQISSKERKISEDLTLKNTNNQAKFLRFNSQKSFENSNPSANEKKNNLKEKIDKTIEQKEKSVQESSFKKKSSQANISLNQSSIHWIGEEQEFTDQKNGYEEYQNREYTSQFHTVNEHIPESPQSEESPLFPYNVNEQMNRRDLDLKLKAVQNNEIFEEKNEDESPDESLEKEQKSHPRQDIAINILQPKKNPIQEQQKESDEENENQNENEESNINNLEENDDDAGSSSHHDSVQQFEGLDDLNQGIILDKCSPNGWRPHQKLLYVFESSQLCWRSSSGSDLKKIKILDIQAVNYGHFEEGISKHIDVIEQSRCMVIKYNKGNEVKALQFVLSDTVPKQNLLHFAQKLDAYVKYLKNNPP